MKSYDEINEKIKNRQAVVVTAEEILDIIDEIGPDEAAGKVDVVTTGTFGAMCSSGAFLNFGHSKPRIKANKVLLNNVEAYAGLAAVDCYIGATQESEKCDNGAPKYGGGHVIEDLVAGREIRIQAEGRGTDCYPELHVDKKISLDAIPNSTLYCPRNAYQNYNCAVNTSADTLYTYMGVLKADMGNATYSGAGQLSPLMNDPYFRTIGVGTRIFLGGGIGYVTGPGTQHNPSPARTDKGIPLTPSGTLSVTGDLKNMTDDWLKGVYFRGYGASLFVGLGIPIPILNKDILLATAIANEEIKVSVVDYSYDYPEATGKILGEVTVADINSGCVSINGKNVRASNMSDLRKARIIAETLKSWIEQGSFEIGRPVESIPAF
ncbi:homocysteine biosynthesis protein [bacterium]|nr:homocysteine biosynthesis protein [bacterium]